MTSRVETPSHTFPSRDHRVTQWKSANTLTRGSARNSSHVNVKGRSTSPVISSRNESVGTRGTVP
jgi:hypothetical protein